MDAILIHDYNEATVTDIPRSSPTNDEVLIRINRVQLSVTDCTLYRGEEIAHYSQIKGRLAAGPARILGHEFCGEIVEIGDSVTRFAPGDRVYAPDKLPCFECPYCASGAMNYCPNITQIGFDIPGALSEFLVLPEYPLCKLPDGVTDAEGAALQPFASAVLAVATSGITLGDVVAVVGTGVMGFQCAQLADWAGASEVFAIDIDPRKLAIAERYGFHPIDPTETDPVDVIHSSTDGVGADIVFEAAGGHQDDGTDGTDPLAQAVRSVRRGGAIIQIGHIIGTIRLTPRAIRSKRIDWIHPPPGVESLGPNTNTGQLAAALVADNEISIDEYITHELPGLEQFDELVDITLDKPTYEALGPAQLIV